MIRGVEYVQSREASGWMLVDGSYDGRCRAVIVVNGLKRDETLCVCSDGTSKLAVGRMLGW